MKGLSCVELKFGKYDKYSICLVYSRRFKTNKQSTKSLLRVKHMRKEMHGGKTEKKAKGTMDRKK